MSVEKTTKILDIKVEYEKAVKGIAEYQIKLEETKKREQELREEIKKQGAATEKQRHELVGLKATQAEYKFGMRELSKEVQNNIKCEKEKEGSLQRLKAELSLSTAAYNKLSEAERNSAQGKDFAESIIDTTQRLKDAEEELGNFHRSVGDYAKAGVSLRTEIKQLTEELVKMKMAGEENSEEYKTMSIRAAELNDAMGDVKQQTSGLASDTSNLDAMTQAAQGLAGAWGAYNSIVGLGINENSASAEVMKNLQISMTALTALTALQNSMQKQSIMMQKVYNIQKLAGVTATNLETAAQSKNIIVSKVATASQWLLNAAAAANPYVLLAMALVTVVGGLVLLAGSSKKAKEELAALNNEVDNTQKKLKQLADDTDFEVRIAEAMGQSERSILDIKRESAKKQLELADKAMADVQKIYDSASKKQRKKMQESYDQQVEMQKQSYDQLKKINQDYSVFEEQRRTDANNDKIEAGKKAVEIRKSALATEFSEIRAAIDAQIALMKDGATKDLATENETYKRKIEDLKKRLETEKNLTVATREAINKQIEIAGEQHAQTIARLDESAISTRIKKEQDNIVLRLEAVRKGSDEEYSLRFEQLNKQAEMELSNAQLTADEKLLIQQKYDNQAQILRDERHNDMMQKSKEAFTLEWQNKINEAALNHQSTLQLELEYRRAELDAMQQMEGESDAAFKARQLAAQQSYVDAKESITQKEIEIEQAKMQAVSDITGSISGLFDTLGEDNKAFAIAGKAMALAQIAVDTGKAISSGIASAMTVPFPGNLAAIATTVATVIANITSAIKTVKSAKFSTGGFVEGSGSSTSDSIPAQLSNGESVVAAMPTSMFGPALSAFNQLGGGAPINVQESSNQIAGENMLARAVAKGVASMPAPVVAVSEINRVSSRVDVVESLGDI